MIKVLSIKAMRKICRLIKDESWYDRCYCEDYVNLFDQNANDEVYKYISHALEDKRGLMVCKFGTIELSAFCCFDGKKNGFSLRDYYEAILEIQCVAPKEAMRGLCHNAGFFPNNISMGFRFRDLVEKDIKEIDILGSYIRQEKQVEKYLRADCLKVNLNGYYAPFLWNNPWTRILENKKVLVIHPFAQSITEQYRRREMLFDDPKVLPKFKSLTVIKAVQSIACNGNTTGFKDWFEALEYMKHEIDQCDYDIALIGCGAYGLSLAAHVKRNRKIAVHLAGWTQMLFGIYGNRWLKDQPEFSRFINEYWVRPKETETPINADKVEGGAYW